MFYSYLFYVKIVTILGNFHICFNYFLILVKFLMMCVIIYHFLNVKMPLPHQHHTPEMYPFDRILKLKWRKCTDSPNSWWLSSNIADITNFMTHKGDHRIVLFFHLCPPNHPLQKRDAKICVFLNESLGYW